MLRLSPDRGEYNMYIYCCVREQLDCHMAEAGRGIRFVTWVQESVSAGGRGRHPLWHCQESILRVHYPRACSYKYVNNESKEDKMVNRAELPQKSTPFFAQRFTRT